MKMQINKKKLYDKTFLNCVKFFKDKIEDERKAILSTIAQQLVKDIEYQFK